MENSNFNIHVSIQENALEEIQHKYDRIISEISEEKDPCIEIILRGLRLIHTLGVDLDKRRKDEERPFRDAIKTHKANCDKLLEHIQQNTSLLKDIVLKTAQESLEKEGAFSKEGVDVYESVTTRFSAVDRDGVICIPSRLVKSLELNEDKIQEEREVTGQLPEGITSSVDKQVKFKISYLR